jgi:hypothetical protein
MDRKKILLVSNGFYPEISPRSYRATELAKEFYRQGHEVTVISKYRDYDYKVFLNEFRITFKMWGSKRFPDVPQFQWKPLIFFWRALSRFLTLFFEYPAIEDMFKVREILKKESGYDMMISFAVPYPVHWGVAWAKNENHPISDIWIADCGDPYMGDVLDSFRKPFYFAYLEKWFCRKADFISIPVESAIPGYYSEFRNKFKVIPQGFDFNLDLEKIEQRSNSVPEFAYAGGFLQGIRDPGPLIEVLIGIDLPFKFYVFTSQQVLLDKYKSELGEKLIISDYIPREELLGILSKMDFLVNFDNSTSLNVPSKLIDYAITNRPVLNINKNFDPEDILAFLRGDYNKRMYLPDPEIYHIKNVSDLFLKLLIPDHIGV